MKTILQKTLSAALCAALVAGPLPASAQVVRAPAAPVSAPSLTPLALPAASLAAPAAPVSGLHAAPLRGLPETGAALAAPQARELAPAARLRGVQAPALRTAADLRAPAALRQAEASPLRAFRGLSSRENDKLGSEDAHGIFRSRYDGAAPMNPALAVQAGASSGGVWGVLGRLFGRSQSAAPTRLIPAHVGHYRVPTERLRWIPAAEELKGTEEVGEAPFKIIGQDRAVEALEFGLQLDEKGYNVFVTGPEGSGRATAVWHVTNKVAKTRTRAGGDLVQVTDFDKDGELMTLRLPAGSARVLKAGMEQVVGAVKEMLPQILEAVKAESEVEHQAIHADADAKVAELAGTVPVPGFDNVVLKGSMGHQGLSFLLQVDGKAYEGDLETAVAKAVKDGKIEESRTAELMEAVQAAMQGLPHDQIQEVALDYARRHQAWNEKLIENLESNVERLFLQLTMPLRMGIPSPALGAYLKGAAKHFRSNLQAIMSGGQQGGGRRGGRQNAMMAMLGMAGPQADPAAAFNVEVLLSASEGEGVPVILEKHPKYENLFGTITVEDGKKVIKPGSFLKADGGYLIVDAWDLVREPGAYQTLIKTLKSGELEVTDVPPHMIRLGGGAPEKVKVKVDVKVVLIGDSELVALLSHYDPDFAKLFQARSQFERALENNAQNRGDYLQVLARLIRKGAENLAEKALLPLSKEGSGKLLEFAAMLAGDQKKLATQFGDLRSLLTEASFFAKRDGAAEIGEAHVRTALEKRRERLGQRERLLREYFVRHKFFIHTEGERVGEINALAVSGSYGDARGVEDAVRAQLGVPADAPRSPAAPSLSPDLAHRFGIPMRVSVVHGADAPGVVWVDNDAGQAGPSSQLALGNIRGFLLGRYARSKPISAKISIKFEQSYNGIDGDSASLAKTIAILSSLSGLPINQGIAITGSMNQKGEAQIIGGVNDKIEGFFDLAAERGLDGTQGVVVPESNLDDMHLREDILEAVKAGKFHIYAVRTVDEAAEILLGIQAGTPDAKGAYPAGTINGKVQARLQELNRQARGGK